MSENPTTPLRSDTSILSAGYWKLAAKNLKDVRILVFAAFIIALRVAVKFFKIPLAAGLSISLDGYVNSIGSLVYGPIVALLVGAVSDTLGCILIPSGEYFLPFILTEMGSAFIFALFFWRQKLSVPRILCAKFTVNLICNIIMTSLFQKWMYYVFYGIEKAEAYAIINGTRIVKNLIMFPLEAMLIAIVFGAVIPLLRSQRLLQAAEEDLKPKKQHYILILALTLLSVALVLFYIFFLKDFVKEHNFKFF